MLRREPGSARAQGRTNIGLSNNRTAGHPLGRLWGGYATQAAGMTSCQLHLSVQGVDTNTRL